MISVRILEFLRSLGFGGLLGSGIAGLFYMIFPSVFPSNPSLENILLVGGLIGAGGHQMINSIFFRGFLQPIGNFINYYGKLVQLLMLRRIIGNREMDDLIEKLTKRYFLDRT